MRVGRFQKVSFDKFEAAMQDFSATYYPYAMLKNEERKDSPALEEMYDSIKLPERATIGSAGYDFFAPFGFTLGAGDTIKIPTGIRAKIEDGWFLCCVPRSGLGCKYRVQLDNTVGIIDSDYYGSDNEGQIFMSLTNDNKQGKPLHIDSGQAFIQGIFLQYGIAYDDHVEQTRNGGMGSTS